ncbi:MAG: hypothetical protein LXA09_06320 [Gemmatimonadetes bacterium]|nr:hypothetical protein [Gemmatimonadota bacterium]
MMRALVWLHLRDRRLWMGPALAAPLLLLWRDLTAWLALPVLFMGMSVVPVQPTLFDATLPVSARTLGVSKLLARLLLVGGVLGAWLLAQPWRDVDGRPLQSLVVLASATMSITLAPFAFARSSVRRAGYAWETVPSVLLLFGLVGVAVTARPTTQLVLSIGALLGTAALVAWRLPRSYVLPVTTAPREATAEGLSAPRAVGSYAAGADTLSLVQVAGLIVRAIGPGWLMGVIGMALAVGVLGSSTQWCIWLVLLVPLIVQRTAWLAMLPIPPVRRLLGIMLLGPVALAAAFGVGANLPVPYLRDQVFLSRNAPLSPATGDYTNPTRLSIAYWRFAPGGQAPLIVSPRGETVEPFTLRVLGLTLYNPYSVRETSSRHVVGWQMGRATQAAFGRPMTARQIRTERPRFRTQSWPMQLLQGSVLLTTALLMLLAVWSGRSPARPFSPWQLRGWVLTIPVWLSVLASVISVDAGSEPLQSLVQGALLRAVEWIGGSPTLVVLVAAAPVALSVWLLVRRANHPAPEVAAFPVSRWSRPST